MMKRAILILLALLCLSLIWRHATRHREARSGVGPPHPVTAITQPIPGPAPLPEAPAISNPRPPVSRAAPVSQANHADTVEVEMMQAGIRSPRVERAAHAEALRQHEEERRSIMARDFLDGINQQVRDREEELRRRTESLRAGLPATGVRELLGSPQTVRASYQTNHYVGQRNISLDEQFTVGQETYYTYSPREGLPFDGRNGQGYDVLCLKFDPKGNLLIWQWERPHVLIGGSMNQVKKQMEYWQGTPQ